MDRKIGYKTKVKKMKKPTLEEKSKARKSVFPFVEKITGGIKKSFDEAIAKIEFPKKIKVDFPPVQDVKVVNQPEPTKPPIVKVEAPIVKPTPVTVEAPIVNVTEKKVDLTELKKSVDDLSNKLEGLKPLDTVDINNLPIETVLDKQEKKQKVVPVKVTNQKSFAVSAGGGSGNRNLETFLRKIDQSTSIPRDPFIEISRGNVPGYSSVLKFGQNPSITSGEGFEDIWDGGGTYVPPTQARIHNIASTDIDDTGTVLSSGTATGGSANTIVDSGATFQTDGVAAGDAVLNDTDTVIATVTSVNSETQITVARWANPGSGKTDEPMASGKAYRVVEAGSDGVGVFWVVGLNANFFEQQEFVVLDGQDDVATAKSYIRQYRARVFTAGATGGAEGVITSTAQTDNTVTCQIINGLNQTQMAIYTVPIDKSGYVVEWGAFFGTKTAGFADVHLRAGTLDGIGYVVDQGFLSTTGDSGFSLKNSSIPFIPGGSDIWIESDSSVAAGAAIKGRFQIILVDN